MMRSKFTFFFRADVLDLLVLFFIEVVLLIPRHENALSRSSVRIRVLQRHVGSLYARVTLRRSVST